MAVVQYSVVECLFVCLFDFCLFCCGDFINKVYCLGPY